MPSTWSTTYVASLLALGALLCPLRYAVAADNEDTAVTKLGTQQIAGAYPRSERALPDGGLTFMTYGLDGNGVLQHVLGANQYTDSPLVPLNADTTPLTWNEKYIVARRNSFYVILDKQTGARVNRRMFAAFSAAAPVIQFDGKALVVAPEEIGIGTAFRRISVPELQVTQRIDVPFTGKFVAYGNKTVGLGRFFEAQYRGVPSVIVLNDKLQLEKRSVVDASKTRNNSGCGFNAPTIQSHYLVYGSSCGGVHVFDLQAMKEVSRRERISESYFHTFAISSNRIAAVEAEATDGELHGFLFEFPSLRPIRSFALDGTRVAASADRLYVLAEPERAARRPYVFDLHLYRIATSAAVPSTRQAALSLATTARRKGTVYSAIEAYEATVPRVMPQDVPELSAIDRDATGWYAGLLASTENRRQDGLDLLAALRNSQLKGGDAKVTRLLESIDMRNRELQAVDPLRQSSFVRGKVSVTGGALPGALAWNDQYLVIARWCGMTSVSTPGQLDHRVVSSTATEEDARDLCERGHPGIAVHDTRDFLLLRFVSLVSSDETIQEAIASITIVSETAYASIERRYPELGDINLVAIDLKDGSITATASLPTTPSLRSDGRALFACGHWGDSDCVELNPSTFEPVRASGPSVRLATPSSPHDFQSDRHFDTHTTILLTDRFELRRSRFASGDSKLVIHSLRDSKETVLKQIYRSLGQGIASVDGRFAYLLAAPSGEHTSQLLRVALDSGELTQLADGKLANLIEFGEYFLTSNDTALDVFDRDSGELLCRWPHLLDERYAEKLIAKNELLMMIYSGGTESLTPSTIIDLRALGVASKKRSQRLRELTQAVDAALWALIPQGR